MQIEKDKIKKIVNEFTSRTFGLENPKGLCFLTCFPISILLETHQIENSITCGDAPRNYNLVNHCWITLDNEGKILDPNMESTYIGKLDENTVTKKYVPINASYQEWFMTTYNNWAEPLINKQQRTFRDPSFENKMNLINIKTATVLYSFISKLETKNQIMSSFKCHRYYSPIFSFLKDKSKSDSNFILNLKNEMPKDFNLLLSKALGN